MTKKEALAIFKADVLPAIREQYEKDGVIDKPARCEAWNNWTSGLLKDGKITERQYSTWSNPF